ncbi:type II secretion system major pseudopilin GspG [Paraburkholderia sp. CNPSo 3076]|uniref:type II secretion system major pseudopilin GspG n=1 Tax=Paraburkholderia sp. CNPSo 3076 TaxID=2940936 RepID=UPI00225C172D|nr:type II secretion system major pseudopilin GspG [Paraburkholderia sp. CNPSo 3076]MCX5540840.1 type II secretion system major pseudopilin GspG [Paraburkholderia sp. CNPSo 3076]
MKFRTGRRTDIAGLRSRDQQGFAFKRIIVVVAMLGVLATLIALKVMSGPEGVKRVAAKQDVDTIVQALTLYHRDNGRYPTQEQGLRALTEKPATSPVPIFWKDGGYLQRLPNDPWGNAYRYLNPGVHGEIDVFSYGADAKQGGEGNDADIGSWE